MQGDVYAVLINEEKSKRNPLIFRFLLFINFDYI